MEKPEAQLFKTVADMQTVPAEKIDHFCEDLRRWLHLRAAISDLKQLGVSIEILRDDVFQWIDDGEHNATVNLTLEVAGE